MGLVHIWSRSVEGIEAMHQRFCSTDLVPRGFVVDEAVMDGTAALITVRAAAKSCACPGCGTRSERVHSRYRRRLMDLPIAGRPLRLMVLARRFYCNAVLCDRRVFAERFDANVLAPWARRTNRLEHIVHHLGLALGGRPAANFARRLMLPVSKDTLLRVVRRRGAPPDTLPLSAFVRVMPERAASPQAEHRAGTGWKSIAAALLRPIR